MNKRERVVLVISILSGLLAAGVIYIQLLEYKRKLQPAHPVYLIVAKKTILRGERIDADKLYYRAVPEKYVSSHFIKKGDEKYIIGGVARNRIEGGKPISSCEVIPAGGKEFYVSLLPEEMIPYDLSLNVETQVGGIVKRGKRISIYLFIPVQGGELLQIIPDTKVIWTERSGNNLVLTIALKRKDLFKLMMAKKKGEIWVAPVGKKVVFNSITWSQLMGLKKKKGEYVEILRGK